MTYDRAVLVPGVVRPDLPYQDLANLDQMLQHAEVDYEIHHHPELDLDLLTVHQGECEMRYVFAHGKLGVLGAFGYLDISSTVGMFN